MTRATPLPPQARRAAIIEATLPLLFTHGPTLTTRQVAEAAGVAEGTIFRVFDSLLDLTVAATLEAISEERLKREFAQADLGDTLQTKTTAFIELLDQRFRRIRTLLIAVHSQQAQSTWGCLRDELHEKHTALDAWLTTHFEPHADELALSAACFASMVRTCAHGRAIELIPSPLPADEMAAVLLNGARKKDAL